jgi:hypothetical protein
VSSPVSLHAERNAVPLGLIFGSMVVALTAVVALLHADGLPFVFCMFKLATGQPCLGCGTTRALGHLAHLDVTGALAMNPLGASLALLMLPWGLADLAVLPRGRAVRLSLAAPWRLPVRVIAVALAVVNWAYLIAVGR